VIHWTGQGVGTSEARLKMHTVFRKILVLGCNESHASWASSFIVITLPKLFAVLGNLTLSSFLA